MEKDIYHYMAIPIEEGHLLCQFPDDAPYGYWGKRRLRDIDGNDLGYEQLIVVFRDERGELRLELGAIFCPEELYEIELEGFKLESLQETFNIERNENYELRSF